MLEEFRTVICTIENQSNYNEIDIIVKDCNGDKVYPSKKGKDFQFNRDINSSYRKKADIDSVNLSKVWLLVGEKDKKEELLQVGRSESLKCMLENDINRDTKSIVYKLKNKYGNLIDNYSALIFYEVDIDKYLDYNDEIFELLKKTEINDNLYLRQAYYKIKASFVEGKIASDENVKEKLWNYSRGLDKEFYYCYCDKKNTPLK